MKTAKYKHRLPQLTGKPFIADGGLETALLFHEGFELPLFAAFPLLNDAEGRIAIDRYMRRFGEVAIRDKKGFLMDTPTWRASARWADELGYSSKALREIHYSSVEYLLALRNEMETYTSPFVINGAIGPQDDGYNPAAFLSADQAQAYHSEQIGWFKEFGADMVTAMTLTYVEEAIGLARAAKQADIDAAISFTVETDGRLPSGQSLGSAIKQVDRESGNSPAYFMINCAHPDHFTPVLEQAGGWRKRIMGIRANASRMSHEELDNAEQLDEGNPAELGIQYQVLKGLLPNLVVMGGCCGTDHRHIDAISSASNHAIAA